ncbi:MAG: peptide chain release factor-like protein [Candidatus Margulisiibacteriota bacterium]
MDRYFSVSMEKETALKQRLAQLGINEADVEERFIRSGGPGGQNVNKVSSGVYLKHQPTGIEVKMTQERSQSMNRYRAWKLLADKVEEKILGLKSARQQAIEKIRRQKRKRSRRAKEKMLEIKKMTGQKKKTRKIDFKEFF